MVVVSGVDIFVTNKIVQLICKGVPVVECLREGSSFVVKLLALKQLSLS